MRKHPRAFDALYVNMVAAGEAGGILDTILQRLSTYIEKSVKLKSQVQSAMIYPIAVISIAAGVVAIILLKVIPTFAALFAGLGAELPLPTRVVIAASNFLARYFIFVLISHRRRHLRRAQRTTGPTDGRQTIDRILLSTPILGEILRKIVGRAILPHAGDAHCVGRSDPRRARDHREDRRQRDHRRRRFMATRKSVEAGETIAEPLRDSKVFPHMVVQMIAVGEQTGALDTMLNKIAEFYRRRSRHRRGGLIKLMEPIMIAILGVVIGGIVIAMYLPMFTLISKIG